MQLLLLALVQLVCAVPLARAAPLLPRDSPAPTPASAASLASYAPPARFASDAYCGNLTVGSRVGDDGEVLWLAGDGRKTQRVYVAHSPSHGIVVAHQVRRDGVLQEALLLMTGRWQGTNTSSLYSLLNDGDFVRDERDARLDFLGSDASVSGGFQDAWLDTADAVLAQVRAALATYKGSRVLVTGHSLGASISLLDAAYLRHETGAAVDTVLFGLPRSGNREEAERPCCACAHAAALRRRICRQHRRHPAGAATSLALCVLHAHTFRRPLTRRQTATPSRTCPARRSATRRRPARCARGPAAPRRSAHVSRAGVARRERQQGRRLRRPGGAQARPGCAERRLTLALPCRTTSARTACTWVSAGARPGPPSADAPRRSSTSTTAATTTARMWAWRWAVGREACVQ